MTFRLHRAMITNDHIVDDDIDDVDADVDDVHTTLHDTKDPKSMQTLPTVCWPKTPLVDWKQRFGIQKAPRTFP